MRRFDGDSFDVLIRVALQICRLAPSGLVVFGLALRVAYGQLGPVAPEVSPRSELR